MYTLFSPQKRALTKISRKKKYFKESNFEHCFQSSAVQVQCMVTSHSVPHIPAFPFWGVGGGGLESFARLSTYTTDIPTELYFSHWISPTCFISSSNSLNVRFPPATSVPR